MTVGMKDKTMDEETHSNGLCEAFLWMQLSDWSIPQSERWRRVDSQSVTQLNPLTSSSYCHSFFVYILTSDPPPPHPYLCSFLPPSPSLPPFLDSTSPSTPPPPIITPSCISGPASCCRKPPRWRSETGCPGWRREVEEGEKWGR